MLLELKIYNNYRKTRGNDAVSIGIGLNTGKLMLGTVGGEERMEGTVISDAVNLAARMETVTKTYYVSLILTEFTYSLLEDKERFHLREIDKVMVKGKDKPVILYECFDYESQEIISKKMSNMSDYNLGLQFFREGKIEEAREVFIKCQKYCPEDPIPVIYVNRCNGYLTERKESDKSQVTSVSYKDIEEVASHERSVLIIDDNHAILQFLEFILSKKKLHIVSSDNGSEALHKYEIFKPEIVFVDYQMPGMNGLEVIEKMREFHFPYRTKIILVTAEESKEIEAEAIRRGADGVISKPIQPRDILDKIS
jgi:CheY-like chemotaxis protein